MNTKLELREGEGPVGEAVPGCLKAAFLLQMLGDDLIPEVFRYLPDRDIARVLASAEQLPRSKGWTPDEVIRDFHQRLAEGWTPQIGTGLSLSKLQGKLEPDRLRNVLKEQTVLQLQKNGGSGVGSGNPLEKLEDLYPATLSQFFANEHPQVTAVVLAHLSPETSGQVIANLPETIRLDVLFRLSRLEQIDPAMLVEISEVMGAEFQARTGTSGGARLGGVESVAEILNRMDRRLGSGLLEQIEKADQEMAQTIRELMYVFDDLVHLTDRDLQVVIKEVPRNLLVLAMKTASQELKDKIFANISRRAAAMLQEDLASLGPTRLREVEKAQREIVEIVRRLETENLITIAQGGESGDVLV